jgi:hypothetical protein
MTDYQMTRDALGTLVVRLADNQAIYPDSEGWPAYQDWLAAGNTPDLVPAVAKPTDIAVSAFFDRFTDAERAAIWPASVANAKLGVGLVQGLASGSVNLIGDEAKAWLDGLVTAGVITAERATEILTP